MQMIVKSLTTTFKKAQCSDDENLNIFCETKRLLNCNKNNYVYAFKKKAKFIEQLKWHQKG